MKIFSLFFVFVLPNIFYEYYFIYFVFPFCKSTLNYLILLSVIRLPKWNFFLSFFFSFLEIEYSIFVIFTESIQHWMIKTTCVNIILWNEQNIAYYCNAYANMSNKIKWTQKIFLMISISKTQTTTKTEIYTNKYSMSHNGNNNFPFFCLSHLILFCFTFVVNVCWRWTSERSEKENETFCEWQATKNIKCKKI